MRVIIAGAGSSGLGVALAAARRRWQVEVLEARDIGSGTSTASTKLIHGGVRYLESALKRLGYEDWKLVCEALRERSWMLGSHSGLCRPLPIVLPVRNWMQKLYYGAGLWLYDKLSYPQRIAKTHWIEKEMLYAYFGKLKGGYSGGWQYWDGQFIDRLYAVHLALFLRQRYGVAIRTHAQVIGIEARGGEVRVRAQLRDGRVYETRGDYLVNAAGPWADGLRRLVRPLAPLRLRLSRGSHLVLSAHALPVKAGFLIPHTQDGRLLFVLPWIEGTVLVGTTEVEINEPVWPARVSAAEEAFLLEHLRLYFDVGVPEVLARFAGYRPLVARQAHSTSRLARSHTVEVWPQERFISLMGGKWTTYRQMGEDVVKAIARVAGCEPEPGEEVNSIMPDWSELERCRHENPEPVAPDLPYTWGEVAFWQGLGWAQEVEDLVAGRWLLPYYDECKAQQVRQALLSRWKEAAHSPRAE